MLSRKPFKLYLLIGLAGLTVLLLIKRRVVMIRAITLLSKYRALLPYIEAQAKHETANFTSNVYKTDHNLFGMKWVNGRREQNATRGLKSSEFAIDGTYYAHFVTDSASVIDLLKWLSLKNFPTSVESADAYARQLKAAGWFGSGYAGDVDIYVAGLKKYLK